MKEKNKGITLIALVVTIVVLLILAGIGVKALLGKKGIIQEAVKAKNETEISEEREKVELAAVAAAGRGKSGEITRKNLDQELKKTIGDNYILEPPEEYSEEYIVTYKDSGRKYPVKNDLIHSGNDPDIDPDQGTDVSIPALSKENTNFISNPNVWTNTDVKVTVSTTVTGYVIQISKDGTNWIEDTNLTFTSNGKMYARLYNGEKAGKSISYNVTNIDKAEPIITETSVTSNSVRIMATDEASGIIGYAVTTETNEPTSFISIPNTKKLDITKDDLEQGSNYYVWVKDEAGNVSSNKLIKTNTLADLTENNTRFTLDPSGWTNKNVQVFVTTTYTDCMIQTSKDNINWSSINPVIFTDNGIVYARLWDGKNIGKSISHTITNIDKIAPIITSTIATANSIQITATDEASGIVGYAVTTESIQPTNFISVENTKVLNVTQTNLTQNTTYYVWIKDEAGNISSKEQTTNKAILKLMKETSDGTISTAFLEGPKTREQIESVTFTNSKTGHSTSDKNCWDVSVNKNQDVLAWYTDTDGDGYYEVTIGADGLIEANENCSNLLAYIGYNGDDTTCIYGLDYLDTSNVTNMSYMFNNCGYTAMTNLDLGGNFNTSNVTNMSYMFSKCGYTAMTKLNKGENFDTSNVTNMSYMFYKCGYTAMTRLALGDMFNTINVTNMKGMFSNCGSTSLETFDVGEAFTTINVTNMSEMFSYFGNKKIETLDLGENFDTSKVTDMSYMFSYCGSQKMTSLKLGKNFNTINVTNMKSMFEECGYYMSYLYLGTKFDTTNVTDMSSMFKSLGKEYTGLEMDFTIDLGKNFNTCSVTNMSYMFSRCGQGNMKSLDLKENFDTSSVTDMSYMFSYCGQSNMTSLDLKEKFDTSNVTNMSYMFNECGGKELTTLNLESNFNTSSVTNMSYMFSGLRELSDLRIGNNFDTSNVTDMSGMFSNYRTKSITNFDITSFGEKFNTSNVTNMNRMFASCGYTSMTSFDLGNNFDTSKVTSMYGMFEGCGYKSMTKLDLGDNFDTSNVTDMHNMFASCGYTSMTSLDLGDKFNTSNVKGWDFSSSILSDSGMNSMFEKCGYMSMTSLNLGKNFDTSNVVSMNNMFRECGYTVMTSLDLGDKFNTSNVTDMAYMFSYFGKNIAVLDLGDKFDTSKVNSMKSMFENCRVKEKVDISAMTFTKVQNYDGIFSSIYGTVFYVKDTEARNFVIKNSSMDADKIIIGSL